jgi:predicted alpha/beta superfamily hydrolase
MDKIVFPAGKGSTRSMKVQHIESVFLKPDGAVRGEGIGTARRETPAKVSSQKEAKNQVLSRKPCLVVLAALLCSPLMALAQHHGNEIAIGEQVKLRSEILGEERTLLITLPSDYSASSRHYPVIFQLDGAERTYVKRLGDIFRLQDEGWMPEVINVSVVNTDRNRDMFPFKTPYHKTSGGADNFMRFVAEELLPFIDGRFRTTRHRTLVGFSASGMFVLYYLLNRPGDFAAYVPCSPSISFATDFFIRRLDSFMGHSQPLEKTLSIVYGSSEGQAFYGEQHYYDMKNALARIVDVLQRKAPKGLNWSCLAVAGGLHVPEGCVYEGLKKVFQGWTPLSEPEIVPAGGFHDFSCSLPVAIISTGSEVFYTTDGSEPTRNSLRYSNPLTVSQPMQLKAKAYAGQLGESETSEATFKPSPAFPGQGTRGIVKRGIRYRYYENFYFRSGLPDLDEETLIESGTSSQITIAMKKRHEGFAVSFAGLIKIEQDGSHTFSIRSNDESKVILDGNEFIFKEKGYSHAEKSGVVLLARGFHRIQVLYVGPAFKKQLDLAVFYEGPGIKRQEIPPEVLFHDQGNRTP